MPLPKPEVGLVIRYSYLWLREFLAGQEEGVKDRPCAIVAAVQSDADGEQCVLVLPVTHSKPEYPEWAVEIPPNVKRHLGLDGERSWIILSESNEFTWSGPDLRRINDDESSIAYGFLPPNLFVTIRRQFLSLHQLHKTSQVRRTE